MVRGRRRGQALHRAWGAGRGVPQNRGALGLAGTQTCPLHAPTEWPVLPGLDFLRREGLGTRGPGRSFARGSRDLPEGKPSAGAVLFQPRDSKRATCPREHGKRPERPFPRGWFTRALAGPPWRACRRVTDRGCAAQGPSDPTPGSSSETVRGSEACTPWSSQQRPGTHRGGWSARTAAPADAPWLRNAWWAVRALTRAFPRTRHYGGKASPGQ